ncbi:Lipid transport protein [Mycena sanguinolenta]|uniref:Lipid transport protein n=1 Tax=Mycena sanguinolenta TaxID=230812 RepID=A0A8H6YRP1_9AGAR|nr:Lipid transport protein [Mycena sanguinolenta]
MQTIEGSYFRVSVDAMCWRIESASADIVMAVVKSRSISRVSRSLSPSDSETGHSPSEVAMPNIRLPSSPPPTTMPAARSPTPSLSRRKLLFSYAPDWIITLALAGVFLALGQVHGFRRQFSLADTSYVPRSPAISAPFLTLRLSQSLRHTFAVHERVPRLALYLIAILAPIVLQAVINLLTVRSWWDLHNGLLGLILGLSITGSITQFTKLTVGRPRPDVIDRCQPIPGSVDPIYGLSNSSICTTPNDSSLMRDGFMSFPSGHSSLSFAGLGFLAFYLAGKLHLFDHRGYAAKAWISLVPFSGAALVAISRTMDYRHHWQDVLIGSILGTVVSYFSYRQYYPSLASEVSDRPYAPRIVQDDPLSHHRRLPSRPYTDNHPTAEDVIRDGPLEGTVLRGGPGPLRNAWREGEENQETSALQPGAIQLESV